MSKTTGIVWFRRDLRLADNPALAAACGECDAVLPVYLHAPEGGDAPLGAAGRWWLGRSLTAFGESLRERGGRLLCQRGEPAGTLRALAEGTGAGTVYWNRCYEPACVTRDEAVREGLEDAGLAVRTFSGALLLEPWAIRTGRGTGYRVFKPFWTKARERIGHGPEPVPAPERIFLPGRTPGGVSPAELGLGEPPEGGDCLEKWWRPGEAAAQERLEAFLSTTLADYPARRERLDLDGTSRLSPHLHFGEIAPGAVWRSAAGRRSEDGDGDGVAAEAFLRQLGWRLFSYHVLHHNPDLPERSLDPRFRRYPWATDPGRLAAWREGRTGFPVVDAAMRQLRRTGWMPNRARMIAASVLTKDLNLSWQEGAAWFAERLVDADLAANSFGWQWAAGSGADAQPFFRIFNPVTQGRKHDPQGIYVHRWLPELAAFDAAWIHHPADAPEGAGRYPAPIVDHAQARTAALKAYRALRGGRGMEERA